MTKKEAKRWGMCIGESIIADGDFTYKEKQDEDAFCEAFWQTAENRLQYAGGIEEDFKREPEWEGFEEGLAIALNKYCKKLFKNGGK